MPGESVRSHQPRAPPARGCPPGRRVGDHEEDPEPRYDLRGGSGSGRSRSRGPYGGAAPGAEAPGWSAQREGDHRPGRSARVRGVQSPVRNRAGRSRPLGGPQGGFSQRQGQTAKQRSPSTRIWDSRFIRRGCWTRLSESSARSWKVIRIGGRRAFVWRPSTCGAALIATGSRRLMGLVADGRQTPAVFHNLALCLEAMGRLDHALLTIEEGLGGFPGVPSFCWRRGCALTKKHRPRAACRSFGAFQWSPPGSACPRLPSNVFATPPSPPLGRLDSVFRARGRRPALLSAQRHFSCMPRWSRSD